jgi:hypothetical protein
MSQLKIQDIIFNLQVSNSAPAPHVPTPQKKSKYSPVELVFIEYF